MATHREGIDPGSKSSAEIEREVRQSRAHLGDTLDAIQERLSPGQLIDQAFGYFRGGGGEFVRNFGDTISRNPVPVTLVGIGLAWMMVSGQRPRRHDDFEELDDWDDDLTYGGHYGESAEPGMLYEDTRPGPAFGSSPGTGTSMGERASDLGESARARASDLSSGAREQASELSGRARDAASDAKERAREAAAGARERAGNLGARAGDRMADARAGLANRAERTSLRARRYGRRARQSAIQTFTDHPLVLGALGLAVGAAIAAALPPSETEDEYLGETGDKLQRRAGETARDQIARARSAAESAYDAASDEAERQGLTPEAAQDASRSTTSKAGKVVDAARTAAEEELKSDPSSGTKSST